LTRASSLLWSRLGFRDDPYNVEPLPVEAEAVALFTGRQVDRQRLLTFVRETPTGRTMVQGPPGVGKTSLVNVVQQELFAAGERCPLLSVVEVPADQTREAFLLTVLSALVATTSTLFGTEFDKQPAFVRARDAVTQTVRTATDLGLSATLPGGIGGGIHMGKSAVPNAPLGIAVPTLLTLLHDLVTLITAHGSFSGVIVPVNNLDTLTEEQAAHFLNTSRDITSGQSAPNIHWIFIAGPALFRSLEGNPNYRRISESFTINPVSLGPLSWDDAATALERRRAHFAIADDTPLPISPTVTREIYEAGDGELRFMMARLSRTVREFSAAFPSERQVPDTLSRQLLSEWGLAQLHPGRLTDGERHVLQHVRTTQSIRARDFGAVGVSSAQRLSQIIGRLVDKHYLKGGDRKPYTLTPAARFAAFDPHALDS
jgi:DNA polymerase III delta prime subunit